jgi:hypothetical protein
MVAIVSKCEQEMAAMSHNYNQRDVIFKFQLHRIRSAERHGVLYSTTDACSATHLKKEIIIFNDLHKYT